MSEENLNCKNDELEDDKSNENIEPPSQVEANKQETDDPEPKSSESSTSSSTSSSSDNSKSEEGTAFDEPPTKRRRRRKRHPKKKKSAAKSDNLEPEECFKARYKNLPVFINSAVPKVHLRFNEEGVDEEKSDYNYKPRIIKALSRNLELHESLKDCDVENKEAVTAETIEMELPTEIISLKPRIIKAIGY